MVRIFNNKVRNAHEGFKRTLERIFIKFSSLLKNLIPHLQMYQVYNDQKKKNAALMALYT